jgi:lysophospholipase L1-like esterase
VFDDSPRWRGAGSAHTWSKRIVLLDGRQLGFSPSVLVLLALIVANPARAQSTGSQAGWVAAWTASVQGPYPIGNPTAQPELKFALPSAERGASDQSFRLIVRPDVWGPQARIRLSNVFGNRPVTLDDAHVGLQTSGSALVPGSNRPISFGGKATITIPPGQSVLSDAAALPWVRDADDPMLANRKLAVSFHVVGESGPMTWHAKGLTTSYLSGPGSGAHAGEEGESAYPFSTTSWYFLDEVDMAMPDTKAVIAFGDSITDGTASTLNGDDRWPDVFSRRVHAASGHHFSVVNAGIGGNMISGPADYAEHPFAGGPAATERLERDVASLPGVAAVIWLQGINDFGNAGADPAKVEDVVREVVGRLRARIPGVKVFMGTLTSAVNSTTGDYGSPARLGSLMA